MQGSKKNNPNRLKLNLSKTKVLTKALTKVFRTDCYFCFFHLAAFKKIPKGRTNLAEIKAKKDIKGSVAIVTQHGSRVGSNRKHVTKRSVGSKF